MGCSMQCSSLSWLTSCTLQSTSLQSGTMSEQKIEGIWPTGWERKPTMVNTLLPQRTTMTKSSTQEA
eukprot:230249-Amphidinium_carterae.3